MIPTLIIMLVQSSTPESLSPEQFLAKIRFEIDKLVRANCSDLLLEMALKHFEKPGKMIRPNIIYRLGKIWDLPQSHLIAWASAVEILHNATLIHDDIQDEDQYRRGAPTIWKRYGVSQAINLGDLLMLIATQPLIFMSAAPQIKVELCRIFALASTRIVNGQSFEPILNLLNREHDLFEDYLKCISQKTATMFALIFEGVAHLAGLPISERNELSKVFLLIGRIFQMHDDILDLYGEKNRENPGCDIREGKVSFLVAEHWKVYPEDRIQLKTILSKSRTSTSDQDVQEITELFRNRGTLASAIQKLSGYKDLVTSDALLNRYPELLRFVEETLKIMLTPIQHLNSEFA